MRPYVNHENNQLITDTGVLRTRYFTSLWAPLDMLAALPTRALALALMSQKEARPVLRALQALKLLRIARLAQALSELSMLRSDVGIYVSLFCIGRPRYHPTV